MKIKNEIIRAYALKNAIEHDGKASFGPIINGLFNHGLEKSKIKEIMSDVNKVLKEVNKLNLDKQKEEFEGLKDLVGEREVREGLRELDNVKGKVIMRFAPSPSGPLHIGHALTATISFLYVQKYGGKFYVRIEDTNPENIYKPAYKMIEEESKWLFDNKVEVIIQSERMPVYYKYAEDLINKNAAYVCTCEGEKFKEFSLKKKDCPCRKLSVKENLERWKRMLDKKGFKEGEAVVRFKSGMQLNNPAMRDFPLARINESKHVLQGNKYKVWPLMNLAVSADDIEMKMTHVIRGKDHRDNAEKQKLIFAVFNKKYPESYFQGRIHFKDLELSSSKIREDIENGKYKGWDDPKLPTVASLKKRGYKPQAFWKFAEQIGLNEVDKNFDKKEFYLLMDNFNKN